MGSSVPKTSVENSDPDSETPKAPASKRSVIPDSQNNIENAEVGGPKGPEPTRFGDWEQKGRCSDF